MSIHILSANKMKGTNKGQTLGCTSIKTRLEIIIKSIILSCWHEACYFLFSFHIKANIKLSARKNRCTRMFCINWHKISHKWKVTTACHSTARHPSCHTAIMVCVKARLCAISEFLFMMKALLSNQNYKISKLLKSRKQLIYIYIFTIWNVQTYIDWHQWEGRPIRLNM